VKLFATTGSFSSASGAGRSVWKSCQPLSYFIARVYGLFALASALAVLLVSVSFAPAAKAETLGPPTIWDYSFSTDTATCTATGLTCISTSGNVVFTLELVSLSGLEPNSPCVKGGWEEVVGMTGSINGAAVSFAPQDVSNCGADQLFLPSEQRGLMRPSIATIIPFTAGGLSWSIFAPDVGPYNNSVLIDNSAGQTAVINWDLVDPPAVTPEPSSIAMALAGLAGLFLLRRGRRLPNQAI
jgi:MYXO-CTERM domain-containing protein